MATRAERLANAYERIARSDHYMVGLVETVTEDERDAAEQILITPQNTRREVGSLEQHVQVLDLALDLLEHDRKAQREKETMERRARVLIDNHRKGESDR